ncbi:ribonuclease T2-like [Physocladia obscura]|uniref:Ribonuclease T2-like n=1 Tax=Physocladia obscura TaxID=109957 RepID=A0AAD5XHL8_9FUNG|nr:ribonuclease T2-like [Physocladia obscura]
MIAKSVLSVAFATSITAMPLDSLFARATTCDSSQIGCQVTNSCCVADNGLLVLALQWLPGYCAANSCSSAVVDIIPAGTWTMHGLWPDTCAGAEPSSSGCDSSRQYTSISALISGTTVYEQMLKYWISYKGTSTSAFDTFWVHEWGVHGTCYSPADISCVGASPADVTRFFSDALAMHAKYDLYTALYNGGVIPNGNTYTKTQFDDAILAAFPGMTIGYACTSGYVNQIQLSLVSVGGGVIGLPSTQDPETNSCGTSMIYAEASTGIATPATTSAAGTSTAATTTTSTTAITPTTTTTSTTTITSTKTTNSTKTTTGKKSSTTTTTTTTTTTADVSSCAHSSLFTSQSRDNFKFSGRN